MSNLHAPGDVPAQPESRLPRGTLVLQPRTRDLGEFEVRRVLPQKACRMVGPFIFFDHFGPVRLPEGSGMDVRPHPHVCLATVTYLFDGEIMHRDSLGKVQAIRPGAVNWMTAGRGIVHSERSPEAERQKGPNLHGIQSWVALPDGKEEMSPDFSHYSADSLPDWESSGTRVRLIAGRLGGQESPVRVASPTLYADVQMTPGSEWRVPAEAPERALYLVDGELALDGHGLQPRTMCVLPPSREVRLTSGCGARLMLLGGEPVGQRYIWWNFVASTRERITRAAADWQAGRFARVPDEDEFIPLPEEGPPW